MTETLDRTGESAPEPAAHHQPTLLVRLADWSYRRRRRVLVFWILLFFGTIIAARAIGGDYHFTFKSPGSDSQHAQDLLESKFPARAGADIDVVFKVTDDRTLADPEVQKS